MVGMPPYLESSGSQILVSESFYTLHIRENPEELLL